MVKVITIMDDVYADLFRIKKGKGMSFTEVLRFLLKENDRENKNILAFAGTITQDDIDRKVVDSVKRGNHDWKRTLS